MAQIYDWFHSGAANLVFTPHINLYKLSSDC